MADRTRSFDPESSAVRRELLAGRRIILSFLLGGVLFQIGLFMFGDTAVRLPLRIGIYALSLAAFFIVRGVSRLHPAGRFVQMILVLLLISLLASTESLLAGVAQAALYLAVLAPLVWVGRLRVDMTTLRYAVFALWAFHSASAGLGVLQSWYPGQYTGAVSLNYGEQEKQAMSIVTADGARILRPQGLTDVAGGAGVSGVTSSLLGFGFLLTARTVRTRLVAGLCMVAALFSVFLSQGRTNLVIIAVGAIAMTVVLIRRNEQARLVLFLGTIGLIAVVSTSLALAVGGTETLDRWLTLTQDDPGQVFYANRGFFLDVMLREDVFKYPLGAGMGRWGMMTSYFGNPAKSLWAEMMWQALLYDGGIPLIALYMALQASLLATAWRIAVRSRSSDLGMWAAAIFAMTLAALAASFVYPVYIKPLATEVFVLNASLYGVAGGEALKRRHFSRPPTEKPAAAIAAVT